MAGTEALFTSLVGGDRLRARVREIIDEAAALAATGRVDVHVMTFSFTDDGIARALLDLARSRPAVTIRIIADWNQGATGSGRLVRRFAEAGLANLRVRYKNDQPYVWDADAGQMRWSYHASRGLLHHKTLGILVDGEPRILVCGSFNWTERAARAYENLLVIRAGDGPSDAVLLAVEREFEALWSDGRLTLTTDEVRARYLSILDAYREDPEQPPDAVTGLAVGADDPLDVLAPPAPTVADADEDAGALVAFSARAPHHADALAGYSAANRDRRFDLRKPSGRTKRAPVTLTTLALDAIARARPDDHLLVAMYGLSTRVPEYGALLDAARRGVRLRVILDRRVSTSTLLTLAGVTSREELPILLRGCGRMMHQKYVVLPEQDLVLTGTANLSTDASDRHTEHRISWWGDAELTDAFVADFTAIWTRPPTGH